ncbi:MAG: exodeoxyribonuclease VII small subunit [Bacteroidetes bacterium]|nr:exodeoxyribonuclease VII small subunit [Bacteroidota bacterium]
MAKTTEEKLTFEQSLERLEDIVQALESGEVPLDETLKKFEEAMTLVKNCHRKLNDAEKKLKVLVKDKNGDFRLEDEASS